MMKEFDDKEFCKMIEDLRKYDIDYKNLQERSIELSDTLLEKLSRWKLWFVSWIWANYKWNELYRAKKIW